MKRCFRLLIMLGILALAGGQAIQGCPVAPQNPASSAAEDQRRDVDHEVELYLLAVTNEGEQGTNIPRALEPVVRNLRSALPYSRYRLAAVFLNRVKDGGTVDVRGVAGPILAVASSVQPTFYDFRLQRVTATGDGAGQGYVNVQNLTFNLRLPVVTGTTRGEAGAPGSPIINYEPIGLATQIGMREGVPTVIGTMASGRADGIIILVATISRTQNR